ncbi:MAG: dienelactone hydrolase family protein [Armatimonadota bacterium]|nr:dienelactone hydrolase family protein [Armatimonadota bacterium]MDR7452210.1 dienelactone hydrolase family protein [Armatimonadota bacterium]MDR7466695.1 dienelactone hydrolase family protein [Armatimonadota bacterium]MDR7492831.1 dienelactone hydrolase family protein [Armatimonadota bacterium]MDR7498607.1 dienelactone hydrolase family protein [Armatimonadota bacterium]
MDDLQRYIVEEWAEDFRAGRLPRREFLRRTALMAGGAALAVSILSGLGISTSPEEVAAAAQGPAPSAAPAPGVTVPPDDPALSLEMVTFPSGSVSVQAYLSRPRDGGPFPGVVVIHENRGLLEHFKDVCRRFSKLGYAALAPDLVSHEGGTPRYLNDLAQVSAILGRTAPERLVEMLNAAVRSLQALPTVRADRIGAIGFCFGGGMTWRLATANADLRAAAPFYGPSPPLTDVPKIRAAVLAVYGELDARINAGIPALREALERARVVHEIVVYPGADHAFFNDTGQRYHAAAAQAAWQRVTAWFERYLNSA